MEPSTPNIRPMELGDLLDAIFRVYRNHFLTFVGAVAVILIPFGIIQAVLFLVPAFAFEQMPQTDLLFEPGTTGDLPFPGELMGMLAAGMIVFVGVFIVIALIQGLVAQPIMYGSMIWTTSNVLKNISLTIRGAYGYERNRMISMIGMTLLVSLASILVVGIPITCITVPLVFQFAGTANESPNAAIIMVAVLAFLAFFVLYIVGSIFLLVRFIFTPQAIVLEGSGVIDSFRRSWSMTRDVFWRTLGILFLVWLIVAAISFVVMLILQVIVGVAAVAVSAVISNPGSEMFVQNSFSTLLGVLVNVFLFPFYGIATTLLYYDTIVRKEGYDMQLKISDGESEHTE